jgi:rubrerythrin
MSNEYRDWLADFLAELTDEQRKNYELCMEYSILIPRNAREDYNYEYTVLDLMPSGWRIAFGEDWARDVQEVLDKLSRKERDEIFIMDIKEKHGFLDVDINYYSEELEAVLDKYKELSRRTCIGCGKPATKISWGWICPFCDICSTKINAEMIDINEFFKED